MTNICELIFKIEKVFLPISAIAVDDLTCMFNIKPDGIIVFNGPSNAFVKIKHF